MEKTTALNKAIKQLGGVVAAANVLKVSRYQVIQQWVLTRVPAEHCPTIERATGGEVTCEELRPDIDWAYLRNSKQRKR